MNRVYVAEDEPLAREALVAMFSELEHWQLAGAAPDGRRALLDCAREPPDLLLTDIKMPILGGLELVAALRPDCPRTQFVFITAYEQHAVQAFRLAAVDYLLKPVTTADFRACLSRVERELDRQRKLDALDRLPQPIDALLGARRGYLETLIIRSVGRIDVVPLSEVLALRATGNYVEVFTPAAMHLHRQTIKTLVEELDPAVFVQIHRSAIVAGRSIRSLERKPAGAEVVLTNDLRLPVSARFLADVERFLSAS